MRHDDLYLADALQALGELREYLSNHPREEFLADRFQQSFLYHRLIIIGEAAVSLRRSYEARCPEVPWAKLAGLRNRLVHAYFDLDLVLAWNIAAAGMGPLLEQLERILETEFPNAEEPGR